MSRDSQRKMREREDTYRSNILREKKEQFFGRGHIVQELISMGGMQ